MADSLPLELQQHIFQYLDPRSFYASRIVSRWWQHASRDAVTLASQLHQMPIQPPVSAKKSDLERLQSVYDEAARALVLGMRISTHGSDGASLSQKIRETKLAMSKDYRRAVSLSERTISVHDLTSPDCVIISQRPLNDLRTAVGGGPWFKCAPTSVHELALSSDGSILAIALERTVQIYDLTAGEESWPVSSYISSAAGHYIAGIQFEQNNSLLRVKLSNKGTVLYLGTPKDETHGLEHWRSKGGLKHAFMDTSRTVVRPLQPNGVGEKLAGLQLLRPFQGGWLFAALKHCTTTRMASYCIGHVTCSTMDGHVLTAERNATILAELPSMLSSNSLPESVKALWNELPSAHVQHPHFSLSQDWNMLAMAENVGVPSHTSGASRVFAYRLPSVRKLTSLLETKQNMKIIDVEIDTEQELLHTSSSDGQATYEIQPFPLSLGGLTGKVLDFDFEATNGHFNTHESYVLTAVTELGSKTWSLLNS